MKTRYFSQVYFGNFKVDFEKINDCKGVVFLEVFPIEKNDKKILVVNDDSEQEATASNPFVLKSAIPIISGSINFQRFETKNTGKEIDKNAKTIVRMIVVI